MKSRFDETQDAYTHNGDDKLLRSLGLRTTGFQRDWTDLGTVIVRPALPDGEYGPKPASTVKVEVIALPAMGWRFTITRPRDEIEELGDDKWRAVYEPVERFVMETGTGGFSTYWPAAMMVAEHMIQIERADERRVQR